MASSRAPKQWCLSKNETVNSFENWKQNLQYTLALDPNFAPFLKDGFDWEKKTKTSPLRGMTDDGEDVPEAQRHTAHQKCTMLELMLGQIANYCPVISRTTIVKNSTSINSIWQTIRLHFGFQSTGGHFLDFASIHLNPDERPEDLYQRLMAFVEDNLLIQGGGITHHGEAITEDEELSPSLENMIVLTWLKLLHQDLPRLVKQRYGTELRSRTLASIRPEISQALDSLLSELQSSDIGTMRSFVPRQQQRPRQTSVNTRSNRPKPARTCPLCHQAGRADFHHFLSECPHLPEKDKKFMLRARQISHILDEEAEVSTDNSSTNHVTCTYVDQPEATMPQAVNRVQVRQSPYLNAFYDHHTVRITIDSGAEGNLIRHSTAMSLHANIRDSTQSAHQADGSSPLKVIGETTLSFNRDGHNFHFEGLVVENLDVDILAGIPFMEYNDITIRPAKRQIILADDSTYTYGSQPTNRRPNHQSVRRTHILRAPSKTTTIWPGEYVEVDLPPELSNCDDTFAIEPRVDTRIAKTLQSNQMWPSPSTISSIAGKIRIPNMTSNPLTLGRQEHFGQIRTIYVPEIAGDISATRHTTASIPASAAPFSSQVSLDPANILSVEDQTGFQTDLTEHDSVFNPSYPGYNGAAGPFQAVVNMGPVQPPQRKGRLPQYAPDKLQLLQSKFDELEEKGVFARPEDIGIRVEYLNPSFLIKKPSGGFRLVTSFGEVGRYSKPQPTLMADVDSTLRKIAKWKFIVATDLTSAFYQIPLSRDSMKYCGVVTPFRGVRVYTRSAMGMPGSETALEELMCRVLGDLLEKGVVAKLADDLYCGGNTVKEVRHNWRLVLQALDKCNLRLSASKTTICPKSTTILGWIWSNGTLKASPHKIATLSTCSTPTTVRGLRSFIGAYKVLARVINNCAHLLSPLDGATAGLQSSTKVKWTDELHAAFHNAQQALSSARAITLPRPDDQLWIVTDGSVKKHSIGSTLYVTRDGKIHLAGFFSAKLRGRQPTWLPCEVEALSIAASTKHFSPYIIQSHHKACILTDSKPCVQAFEKLCRGEFSTSPRVSTFLSAVSRYHASVRHLAGSANVPSDFASRNAPDCFDTSCQVCAFVKREEDSVVMRISTQDVLSGHARLPFTGRSAWASIQQDCPDLRRCHAHLTQGTRPSKKATNIKDVKRYLQVATVARDGLLVVNRTQPLVTSRECIIVPRQVLCGLLTALHIQLEHPTRHQLRSVVQRQFYALDLDKAIDQVTSGCHHCASLSKIPQPLIKQSTCDPPPAVGISFAADVLRRSRQYILLLRESSTSYTTSCFLDNERHDSLRDGLIRLSIELRPLDGPPAVIRTDAAPGFVSLVDDQLLRHHHLTIEVGRIKNKNKNPVAEKAIQELEEEILRIDPSGGSITSLTLSIATANLNARVRSRGLSSREMWYQRDQFSNQQLPVLDHQIIQSQHQQRKLNHPHSERSKSNGTKTAASHHIDVGDLVYLYSDRDKSRSRSRYLVTSVDGIWCNIQKFIGSQLRSMSYRVKQSECYKVPSHPASSHYFPMRHQESDDEVCQEPSPPAPPIIPTVLSTPAVQSTNDFSTEAVQAPSSPPQESSQLSLPEELNTSDSGPSRDLRRSERQRRPPLHLQDYVIA